MRKNVRWGRGLFAAGLVAALGFGATQAFAGVAVAESADRCTDWCIARYNACMTYGWGNCYEERVSCLESCAIN